MRIKKLSNGNYEIDEKTLKGLLISRYELDALESVLEDITGGQYDEQ